MKVADLLRNDFLKWSSIKTRFSEVPQGSIVGLHLYPICIND